ncbi:hypothetical protein [Rhizorhabdus histidinilytica]|uniref:hypothetical protein n=1 Tax=Rhizorhabdus histidinilytica TaxID=439228 RepID=UPI00321F681B
MTLKESLIALANVWCTAHGRQLSSLGTLVVKDSKFFARLADRGGLTVATFERFIGHFRDAANWPGQTIPDEASAILNALPPHEPVEQFEMAIA